MPAEVCKQLQLTQRTLGEDLLAEDVGELLDGHAFSRLVVGRGADNAIRALAHLFRDRVAFVDDEVLVEDLEDLAAVQRRVAHFVLCLLRLRPRVGR